MEDKPPMDIMERARGALVEAITGFYRRTGLELTLRQERMLEASGSWTSTFPSMRCWYPISASTGYLP